MGSDPSVSTALIFKEVTYLHVSVVTLMIHEWFMLFECELEYIWKKRWNLSKVLFIMSRYGLFIDMPITIALHLSTYGALDYNTCGILYKIATWFAFFGIAIAESILLLRTNAIYSGSKRVTIPLTIYYVVATVAGVAVVALYLRTAVFGPPPSELVIGCYLSERSVIIFFDFLLLLVFELAVVVLTVWNGYRDCTPLLRVIYRDSVVYFFVLFALTLSTILALALAPAPYSGLVPAAIRVGHSVVCCRIILNLKQAAAPEEHTSTAVSTSLVFASSPRQTNQPEAESVPLEIYGTRNDEDPQRPTGGSSFPRQRIAS